MPLPVLLEVNISGEAAKHGLVPESIEPILAEAAGCRNVAVRGLMCMAGLEGGLETARRDFAALRELRDRLRRSLPSRRRAGRAFDGHERRFRNRDRRRRHHRSRWLGTF